MRVEWQCERVPSGVAIRRALASDVPALLRMIRALAEYEKEPDAVIATESDLFRDGFGEVPPRFHALMAVDGEEAVGFAIYVFAYSTWVGRSTLYLEDLFVDPSHRGQHIGLALMRELARVAVERKCGRFVWQVLDWNEPALKFYESLGAGVLREWVNVRLSGEALRRLAEGDVGD
jgi:GNAT superfamily N-acetyltransferase